VIGSGNVCHSQSIIYYDVASRNHSIVGEIPRHHQCPGQVPCVTHSHDEAELLLLSSVKHSSLGEHYYLIHYTVYIHVCQTDLHRTYHDHVLLMCVLSEHVPVSN